MDIWKGKGGSKMYCRNCGNANNPQASVCTSCGVPRGAGNHFCPQCGAKTDERAGMCGNCGLHFYAVSTEVKSKLVAGLLAIFLGYLGIHNFYLGYTNKGLIQILVSIIGGVITCGIATAAISIWALVEGILILTGKVPVDAKGIPLKD